MRAVLDTNVIISALFWDGNERKLLERCRAKEMEMQVSPGILDEVDGVLERKFSYPDDKRADFRRSLLRISRLVHPMVKIDVVKGDPHDNHILECAVESGSDYIVSGDTHLLRLKNCKGICIVNAKEMLRILQKG